MTQAALQLASALQALNGIWEPHDFQRIVLNALFIKRLPIVFVECGRKWGKTEIINYFLWRNALLRRGGYYYLAPEQDQAREIIWAAGRIQGFGPQEYIASINKSEMRITLTNGSFIKVDGSDNYNKHRGTEPHGIVYDEFRDFRPELHKAVDPNLGVYEAQLLICTTPPEPLELDHYDGLKNQMIPGESYFNYPSWCNPHMKRDWFRKKKAELYDRGEGDVWEREYGAKRVMAGSNAIFPMYAGATKEKPHTKHVRPHAEVMAEVMRDKHKMHWQVIADPGTSTVFCVLFRAINPYTRRVYRLDMIYEKSMMETSTSRILPRVRAKRDELCPDWKPLGIEWQQIYDEAAAWFNAELMASFPGEEAWTPTQKATRDKKVGLSLLKDQLLHELPGRPGEYFTVISDRCVDLNREIIAYLRKPDGTIPKGNDHAIDCDRYGNDFAGIDLAPVPVPKEPDPDDQRRAFSIEDDLLADSDDFELEY